MPATLTSTWSITTAAGQPPSVVRLRNLQSTARVGVDAWGRPTRPQPLLISASVSLVSPFASSSSSDTVSADTVHYGHLSKAVLSTLDDIDRRGAVVKSDGGGDPVSLRRLLDEIWWKLTGRGVDGSAAAPGSTEPFLDVHAVRCLSVSAQLPKASLVGGCVELTGTSLFRDGEVESYGMCLRLSGIRVPTLIGINDNEREAKQVVVADISIDCLEGGDVYPSLEKPIYDTMTESSFGTLEALAVSLAESIRDAGSKTSGVVSPPSEWQIKIGLEKPIAVPLAEGAGIEFVSGPSS